MIFPLRYKVFVGFIKKKQSFNWVALKLAENYYCKCWKASRLKCFIVVKKLALGYMTDTLYRHLVSSHIYRWNVYPIVVFIIVINLLIVVGFYAKAQTTHT